MPRASRGRSRTGRSCGANPYAVLEGALIAARAVGAPTAVIALKATFTREVERVEAAIAEMEAAGWVDRGVLSVFRGPREYLYGEETALLEAVAGRPPFPRIAPPWRRGATEVVESTPTTPRARAGSPPRC